MCIKKTLFQNVFHIIIVELIQTFNYYFLVLNSYCIKRFYTFDNIYFFFFNAPILLAWKSPLAKIKKNPVKRPYLYYDCLITFRFKQSLHQDLTAADSSTVPMTLTVLQSVKVTKTAQRRNLAAITRGEIFASCDRRYSKKDKTYIY